MKRKFTKYPNSYVKASTENLDFHQLAELRSTAKQAEESLGRLLALMKPFMDSPLVTGALDTIGDAEYEQLTQDYSLLVKYGYRLNHEIQKNH